MRTTNKKIIVKAVPIVNNSQIIAPNEIEFYEVIAVGSAVKDVNVGDKIFYHLGTKFMTDGKEYVSINEDDVQVIL